MQTTEHHVSSGAGAGVVEMSALVDLVDKIRSDMKAEKDELRVEMKTEKEDMLAQAKADTEASLQKLREELTPREVVTDTQVKALQTRLEALHAAQLISDDELFVLEDCIADFFGSKRSFDVATLEIASTNHAVGKMHLLVLLTEGVERDAPFARQLRRKFM